MEKKKRYRMSGTRLQPMFFRFSFVLLICWDKTEGDEIGL